MDKPTNDIERAADAAFEAFSDHVRRAGGELDTIVIYGWATGLEPNAISASFVGEGETIDAQDLLAFLLANASELGKRLGLEIQIHGAREG